MASKDYLTVEQLNFYINNIFLTEELLHNVPVVGEVSDRKVVGGHCYFTLKDANAQIKIVFFNCERGYVPYNGEQVLVRGSVDYYQKNGQISVRAYEISRFGIGQLYAKLEELKEKLTNEGLFLDKYKKEIPLHPSKIAVITSAKGAALQDFLTTASKNNSLQHIDIVNVRVQGEYCVSDIITALNNCDHNGYDVIIIARGGGSFEDLYCFNDEKLVRCIFNMDTPIISAVGHETDYTLCDFVADYRAITPTAAAEKVAYSAEEEKIKIKSLIKNISQLIENNLNAQKENLMDLSEKIEMNANFTISNLYNSIKHSLNLLNLHTTRIFDENQRNLHGKITRLDDLSPTKLLKSGYFRILHNNSTINDFSNINENDEISIIGKQEKVTAKVIRKEQL